MEKYIDENVELLDEKGFVKNSGYSDRMVFKYDRKRIKSNPFSLKEWDFYQINHQDYVIQLTFGHVSYAANFSFNIFNIKDGRKFSISKTKLFPMRSLNMPENPEDLAKLYYKDKEFEICFQMEQDSRILSFSNVNSNAKIMLFNRNKSKIVIATPFEKRNQFYLNCKENFFGIDGYVNIGDISFEFDSNDTAVLDWGRGIWPFKHQWFWGNGAAFIDNNKFSFNIGWGFGNTSNATENIFFWNDKANKIEKLEYDVDLNNYMNKWHFYDEKGIFDLEMTPIFDNYTENKLLFIHTKCHQVWGYFNGYVKLPDNQKIEIENILAFCEHAVNRW